MKPSEVVEALAEIGIHLRDYKAITLDDATSRTVRKVVLARKEAARKAAAEAAAKPAPPPAAAAPETASAPAPPRTEGKPARRPSPRGEGRAPLPTPSPAEPKRPAPQAASEAPVAASAAAVKRIQLPDRITVRELAEKLQTPVADVITRLVSLKHLATVTQSLTRDVAAKVASQYGFEVEAAAPAPAEAAPVRRPVARRRAVTRPLQPRPPVVTILGHVDHGKTTLLDAIRKTDVVSSEFGGITQHIGAYQTEIATQEGNKRITFIDTPGHAAFTRMRARGAQVTDIVILVVAADDGVMPQTVEAIDHARAAKVPIIVAINKVDKEDANVERTKQQLMEHGLVPEEYGGDTIVVEVSALKRKGIDDLLEMITLVAEMAELRGDPAAPVSGTVLEAKLEKGRGAVATVLVQEGTLKTGDVVVANTAWGRVRAMTDDRGRKVTKAGPATPVEIIGLDSVPMAGDRIEVVKDEREAREITGARLEEQREKELSKKGTRVTLQTLLLERKKGETRKLNVILKADVQGSVEVLREALEKLNKPDAEITLEVLHAGVGTIGESDIMLADASNGVVIGFNTRVEPNARRLAEDEGIDVRCYNVIYELIDDVEAAMKGMLKPVLEERVLGTAEVRAIFRSPRGAIAGCLVTEGRVQRGADVRVLRGNEEVFVGKLSSLRHLKDDVREMAAGFECGIMLDGFNDFQEGDVIQAFVVEEVHRA
ncbi:MAG: translation initiation factor IF-2 [Armatimonadota bacterium]|nr:translation initiation factor IF-2 [Armatimonadota bacterium]